MPAQNTNNMALLKVADKLVRNGDLKGALDAILKARQLDATNRYAEAYEDRVRALLQKSALTDETAPDAGIEEARAPAPTTAAPSSRLAEIVELLDHANASIARNEFHEALDYIGKARQLDPENEDIGVLEEQVRGACDSASSKSTEPFVDFEVVRSTLEAYISEAMELAAKEDFEEALHLITKGFLLDPANQDLRAAERHITTARELLEKRRQTEAIAAEHYRRLVETDRVRHEDLVRHIECARKLLRNRSLDDALTEVALGYTIDSHSAELKQIEQEIWQEKRDVSPALENPEKNAGVARLIRLYILSAEEFAKNGDFVKALDGLARAFVIDPANVEIKRAEVRIRQAELRYHQASGSPLKLVYHHDRAVNEE